MRNKEFKCDILDDDLIKKFAKIKIFSLKNIVYILCIFIFAVLLWKVFDSNVLIERNSVLAENEKRNTILLCAVMFLLWLFLTICFILKLRPLFKILKNNYWCFASICNDKYIKTTGDYDYSAHEDRSYSTYYFDIEGLDTNPKVSKNEYETINKEDKCIAILIGDIESRQGKDVALVIKCNIYAGNKQLINYDKI